jgi:hypothetical protein
LTPALAIRIALATLGSCEVRRRDTQCLEVLLLDRREWVGGLALELYFDDHHCRKLGHHHESCRLVWPSYPTLATGSLWSPRGPGAFALPDATAAAPVSTPARGLRSARAFSETGYDNERVLQEAEVLLKI